MNQSHNKKKKTVESVPVVNKASVAVSKPAKVIRQDIENTYPFPIPNES